MKKNESLYNPKDVIGKRIRLIKMDDEYTDLTENSLGTIKGVDDMGHILVRWDNGSSLSIIPEVDEFEIIEESKKSLKYIKMFEDFESELENGLEILEAEPDSETAKIKKHFPGVNASTEEFEKSEYFSGDPDSYNLEWNMYLSDKANENR
jgi:hypothetical protein